MPVLTWMLLIIAGLGLAYAVALAIGARRWSSATDDLVAQLDATRNIRGTSRYRARELEGLPAPAQRYFRAVLTEGQGIITGAVVTQTGTFDISTTGGGQWKPFTAMQHVTTKRPGFVWNAAIMLFPGVPVRVADSYVAGTGALRPAILGLFSMGDLYGTGEIARGELMRWFSETVWYPTALLPSQGVVWQAVDEHSSKATMTDGPITLTLLFRFGADGLVESIHADARAQKVDGANTVFAPWHCTMTDYRRQDGMLVPFAATAGWVEAAGVREYYRGRLNKATYTFAD